MALYVYRASLLRVVDGDTLDLLVDVGFHLTATLRFRLLGIDAPEMRGPTHDAGVAARAALIALLATAAGPLTIHTEKGDSFGRWLALVSFTRADGAVIDVSEEMLRLGHATVYS